MQDKKSSETLRQQRVSELIRSHNQNRNTIRALQEHIEQDHELLKRIWELLEYWEKAPIFYRDSSRSLRACFDFDLNSESEPANIIYPDSTEEEDKSARGALLREITDNCSATSWKGRSHRPYGPGGWNRCILAGHHETHEDSFGNIFEMENGISHVTGHRASSETASSTEEEGEKKNG